MIFILQVRWMMYWIVYAIFSAVESIMDPILYFWYKYFRHMQYATHMF